MNDRTIQIGMLRHGETEIKNSFCGSTDTLLTTAGWDQMWKSIGCASISWQRIISSPLKRCAQFAKALAERHAIPLTQDDRFKEIHFGDWESMSVTQLLSTDADALTCFWKDPIENPPPRAESLPNFKNRILEAWNEIPEQYDEEKILLITHGGVIRTLWCHLQHLPLEQLLSITVPHADLKTVKVQQPSPPNLQTPQSSIPDKGT